MTNITSKIQRVTRDHPSATALGGDEPLTFSKLWSETDAFAGALRDREITAGDAVAIRPVSPRAFLVAVYGTLRNGSVPVTVPADYSAAEAVEVLDETGAKAYVTDEERIMSILNRTEAVRVAITVDSGSRMGVPFRSVLENDGINTAGTRSGIDVVGRAGGDRALVAYVGRLEGAPVGVSYTHSAMAAAADIGGSVRDLGAGDHHLGALPLSSPVELLYGATAAILAGGRYAPSTGGEPEAVRSALSTDEVDRTFVTRRQYEALRDLEGDATGDTGTDATGAANASATGDTAADETGPIAVVEPPTAPIADGPDDAVRLRGSPETGLTHRRLPGDDADGPGETLPRVEAQSLEDGTDGELAVRSPAMTRGYVGRPDLTDEATVEIDGARWLRTGAFDRAETGASYARNSLESRRAGRRS